MRKLSPQQIKYMILKIQTAVYENALREKTEEYSRGRIPLPPDIVNKFTVSQSKLAMAEEQLVKWFIDQIPPKLAYNLFLEALTNNTDNEDEEEVYQLFITMAMLFNTE